MIVKKGIRVGTEFGEGTVVAVTKEWVVVDVGGKSGEVALHIVDSPVWVVPTGYGIGGGDGEIDRADAGSDTFPRLTSEPSIGGVAPMTGEFGDGFSDG
ncbi:hypothetical protein [Kordiimonas sp.]|uniref:hypothetical protein n=1 Tax=Kordiimonas sp. TaxID=1970157 RepID=UPI003A8CE680